MTARPAHQSLRVSQFVNDDTTADVRVMPTGSYSWLNFANTSNEEVTVFGDRDTLRRLLAELREKLDAAEAAMQAEELGRMDAERERVGVEDAAYEDEVVAGADPTYGRGV